MAPSSRHGNLLAGKANGSLQDKAIFYLSSRIPQLSMKN
jgi:hypothetical protein